MIPVFPSARKSNTVLDASLSRVSAAAIHGTMLYSSIGTRVACEYFRTRRSNIRCCSCGAYFPIQL